MKKILIVCNVDPNSNPRPNRMIRWLKDDFEIAVLSRNKVHIEGVKSYVYNLKPLTQQVQRNTNLLWAVFYKIMEIPNFVLKLKNILLKRYEQVNKLQLGDAHLFVNELTNEKFDLIISHNLSLLPLAFQVAKNTTKIMFDAREYYPKHFDDSWIWRLINKPVNQYLCTMYLRKCSKVITVSKGLSSEYSREYGVDAEVIMSLPAYQEIQPVIPQLDKIRMIHHGSANPSRKIEVMLELMDCLDERFTLDLMMVVTDHIYWNKILKMAEQRKNVNIIPPVLMLDIVKTINQYDVGLFLVPPINFNLTYTLPNKLFEFIQARLAVAIGPSIDMKKIVEEYKCGIISSGFSPVSLANELNKLTPEKIMHLKLNSHKAAVELSAEMNRKRIHEIIEDLLVQ